MKIFQFVRAGQVERTLKVTTYRVRWGRRWGVMTREWTRLRSSDAAPMWVKRFPKRG